MSIYLEGNYYRIEKRAIIDQINSWNQRRFFSYNPIQQ